MNEKYKCQEAIMIGYRFHPCGKTAKAEVKGKWYCGTHDPVKRQERRDEADQKYKESCERGSILRDRIQATLAACEGVDSELLTPGTLKRMRFALETIVAHAGVFSESLYFVEVATRALTEPGKKARP